MHAVPAMHGKFRDLGRGGEAHALILINEKFAL